MSTFPSREFYDLISGTAHTLIAGTTGSGKSVLLNQILCSLMAYGEGDNFPAFVLVDTKRVELREFGKVNGYCRATDPEQASTMLNACTEILESRFEVMERDNLKKSKECPVYIVIDELADLLYDDKVGKACLQSIIKIGRLGRAARMHLICCTQDPSRTTLSAQLMQNFTTCIALHCKSDIESKQIIGICGAEKLPKHGTVLVSDPNGIRKLNVEYVGDEAVAEFLEPFIKAGEELPMPEDDSYTEDDVVYPEEVYVKPAPVKKESFMSAVGKTLGSFAGVAVIGAAFVASFWVGLGLLACVGIYRHATR